MPEVPEPEPPWECGPRVVQGKQMLWVLLSEARRVPPRDDVVNVITFDETDFAIDPRLLLWFATRPFPPFVDKWDSVSTTRLVEP